MQPFSGEKHKGLISLEFVLMNTVRHLKCFLHILTTHPSPRKGYFLLPDVMKSKEYKVLVGCCVLTNAHSVQQDIYLQPHVSEIACTGGVAVWMGSHTCTERCKGDRAPSCVRLQRTKYTHVTVSRIWTHGILMKFLTCAVIAGTETELCCSQICMEMPAHWLRSMVF